MRKKHKPSIEERKKEFDVRWDKFISELTLENLDRDIVLYYITIAQNLDWEFTTKIRS